MTPRQWKLYRWLEKNAVGLKNIKSRLEVADALNQELPEDDKYEKTKGEGVQHDIRAIRIEHQALGHYVCSNNKGYYMPINEDELKADIELSRAIGHIETVLKSGLATPEFFYNFLNDYKGNVLPMNNQMKFQFSKYENDRINKYADELEFKNLDELKTIYLQLGGYPVKLSRQEYIMEIKKLVDNK